MIKDMLGEEPITKIALGELDTCLNCSNFTLNELLSVLYLNIAEGGL